MLSGKRCSSQTFSPLDWLDSTCLEPAPIIIFLVKSSGHVLPRITIPQPLPTDLCLSALVKHPNLFVVVTQVVFPPPLCASALLSPRNASLTLVTGIKFFSVLEISAFSAQTIPTLPLWTSGNITLSEKSLSISSDSSSVTFLCSHNSLSCWP